jgi:hypothetical protein
MPVPDFSPGEVLTAAAMDSIGMWLVKTQTIGTGVSSVAVTGAFSADYDNYLIVLSGGTTGGAGIRLQMTGAAAGYYFGRLRVNYSTAAITAFSGNNVAFWEAGTADALGMAGNIQLTTPFLTRRTVFNSQQPEAAGGVFGWVGGTLENSNSYTGFTLTLSGGTFTGGTVRVYGLRN